MAQTIVTRQGSRRQEAEWPVVAVVALALLLGWLLQSWVQGDVRVRLPEGVTVHYPASWLRTTSLEPNTLLQARDGRPTSSYPTQVTVRALAADVVPQAEGGSTVLDLANGWSFQRASQLEGYRVLDIGETVVSGTPAARVEYGFIQEPTGNAFRAVLPVVVQAVDYLIPRQGRLFVVTLAADAADFEAEQRTLDTILNSITLGEQP